jgi:hypothetical protein
VDLLRKNAVKETRFRAFVKNFGFLVKKRVRTDCRERVRLMFLIALGEKKKRVFLSCVRTPFFVDVFSLKKRVANVTNAFQRVIKRT